MPQVTLPYSLTDGTVADAAQVMSNLSAITSVVNGNIDNTNLSTSLTITDSHLSQIQSAAKVNGTALTNFVGIPSGAGVIPLANLPALAISQILNYGSSTTTGTTVPVNDLIIVYGLGITINSNSSVNITNLPFTSSSTYTGFVQNSTGGAEGGSVEQVSGSSANLLNNGNANTVFNWCLIGY